MPRSTGWAASSRSSKPSWPVATCRMARCCSTTVTSTYLEGRCCELAQHGYSRDHRSDRPQIVIGLMCTADGCPVAVEVFEGNTADPLTLSAQIDKLKQRFKLQRVVMVGDRR